MDLSNNDFSVHENTIPSSFCNLANLTSLKLSRSYLRGSIPTCLGKLSFEILDLSFNKLTGPIPPFSNPIPSLQYGPIPPLSSSVGLHMLILSNNRLTGPIPNEFGNLSIIEHLDLGGNCLSGTIPSFIFKWKLLGQLDLSSNMFSGEFPLAPPR